MPRIYDCFSFMNELDLLELRLNELDPVVDYFVLAEATVTHSGKPKPLHFREHKPRFDRFAKKIIHLVIDDMPGGGATESDRFAREGFQRNALLRGLQDADPDDFVIISDLDEIPRASAVESVTRQQSMIPTRYTFEMRWYWYYLNLRHPELWTRSRMGRRAHVRRPELFRMWGLPWTTPANPVKRWLKTLRRFRSPLRLVTVPDAGWHFTRMNGVQAVHYKLSNYSHVRPEDQLTEAAVTATIEDALSARRPFDGTNFQVCEIDRSYPAYLRNNLDRYRHMIAPTDGAAGGADGIGLVRSPAGA